MLRIRLLADGGAPGSTAADGKTLEVLLKPIFGVILNQPGELKLGKNPPTFLKGGGGIK
jgi:hypothetical protein